MDHTTTTKKKRLVTRTTVEFKKELIAQHERGFRVTDLAKMYGKPSSTICTILSKSKEIKAANVAKGVTVLNSKQRTKAIEEMEKLLFVWVDDRLIRGEGISERIISEKARQLHRDIVKTMPGAGDAVEFKASRGWFEKFMKRREIYRSDTDSHTNNADGFCVQDYLPELNEVRNL